MASTRWTSNKGARIAASGSLNQGAGASDYNPWGTSGGYTFRTLIGFSYSLSGITAIDKAVLWVRLSGQHYVAFGSDPTCYIDLITEAWSEGSSSALSTGNAVVYPGPSVSTSNRVTKHTGNAEGDWVGIVVTGLIRQAFASGVFHGLRLIAPGSSSSDVGEIYSDDTTSEPYLDIDYTSNRAPNQPTPTVPAANAVLLTGTPTFSVTGGDPDAGDTFKNYDLQVSTDAAWATATHWNALSQTDYKSGWSVVNKPYAGVALTRGVTYYWRSRFRDQDDATSAWSPTRSFIWNALPEIVGADLPYGGANHVAPIHNLNDPATVLGPKPQFTFKPRSADGQAANAYQVEVSGVGVETVFGSVASGATVVHKFGTALVNLTSYQVRFRASDAAEGYGAWSAWVTFAVKYAQAIYDISMAGATSLSVAQTVATGVFKTQRMYRTASASGGGGTVSPWSANVPSTVPAFLNVMVRTASEGSAPVQPKVTSLTINYTNTVVLPYSWTFVGAWSVDTNVRRYGVKSLVVAGTTAGADRVAYQTVPNIAPDTEYAISAWLLIEDYVAGGTVTAALLPPGSTSLADALASVSIARNTVGWERISVPYTTEEGVTDLRFAVFVAGTTVSPTQVHLDAAMLSEGAVAPVWTPSLVGNPLVVDAQGLYIDGRAGGLLQLYGSAGGSRDIVELGAHGLLFGDTEVYSPVAGEVTVGGKLNVSGAAVVSGILYGLAQLRVQGIAFPTASLTAGDRFFRRDLGMDFYWNGTRWLCACQHLLPLRSNIAASNAVISATQSAYARAITPALIGSDIWIEDYNVAYWIETGGTALGAAHNWSGQLFAIRRTGNFTGDTKGGASLINSGASLQVLRKDVAVGALMDGGTAHDMFQTNWTKTGTPGNLIALEAVTYRHVAV